MMTAIEAENILEGTSELHARDCRIAYLTGIIKSLTDKEIMSLFRIIATNSEDSEVYKMSQSRVKQIESICEKVGI